MPYGTRVLPAATAVVVEDEDEHVAAWLGAAVTDRPTRIVAQASRPGSKLPVPVHRIRDDLPGRAPRASQRGDERPTRPGDDSGELHDGSRASALPSPRRCGARSTGCRT